MKKKIFGILICCILVMGLTGCGNEQTNQQLEKKENQVNEKNIICSGNPESTSEDEMEFKQSYIFHFKDDEATTLDLIQNMKLLKDTEDNRKQLTEQNAEDYKNNFKSIYEYMKLEVPDFDVKINDISKIEREVTITFNYKDFVSILGEEDVSKYVTFDEISNHIKELTNDEMTCTYNGKVITNN